MLVVNVNRQWKEKLMTWTLMIQRLSLLRRSKYGVYNKQLRISVYVYMYVCMYVCTIERVLLNFHFKKFHVKIILFCSIETKKIRQLSYS